MCEQPAQGCYLTSGINASSRVGGRSAEGCGVWAGGSAFPQKIFSFVISKWHILVNSEVLNLKYVIILEDILTGVPPNQNIGGDVSPSSPAGLTPVVMLCSIVRHFHQ